MAEQDPKQIVREFLATFSRGDIEGVIDAMTPDATWWVSGRIDGMSGTNSRDQLAALLRQVKPLYVAGALRITPTAMIAEGGHVAVEADSFAELVNGRVYSNGYHFLFEVADGKIARVKEYSDTAHMLETFAP